MKSKFLVFLISLMSFQAFSSEENGKHKLTHECDSIKKLKTDDAPMNSHFDPIIDQALMTQVFSFLNIPSTLRTSRVCRYFNRVISEDTESRSQLTIRLPIADKNKLFYRLSDLDVLSEFPRYDSAYKIFAGIFTELKMLSLLDQKLGNPSNDAITAANRQRAEEQINQSIGFLFEEHLPRIPNRRQQPLAIFDPEWTAQGSRSFVSRVESTLTSLLNTINPRVRLRHVLIDALDIINDDDDLFNDGNVQVGQFGAQAAQVPPRERSQSDVYVAQQEFDDYVKSTITQLYDRYTARGQCGELIENHDFKAQIKMAIGIEIRNSEYYQRLAQKKSEQLENDYRTLARRGDEIFQSILDLPLSAEEQNNGYMNLCRQIVHRIIVQR